MGDLFESPADATPLDEEARKGLIPSLQIRRELNEFEAANITEAVNWAHRSHVMRIDYPSMDALRNLHRHMFNRTWRWAGRFRQVETNIGIAWPQIATAVLQLCDNIQYRLGLVNIDGDRLTAEFHHRLVSIHAFPNGNGRHARVAADLLRRNQGWTGWSWGINRLVDSGATRSVYIGALQAADRGDIEPLIAFAR